MEVDCCIVGGGPAGMMLGCLLARAGVAVVVLEKHGDFLRDFRGDTIHPSTLELMHELGQLERFMQLPHQKAARLMAQIGDAEVTVADFSRLPVKCPYIAFMPQWDFLNFLAEYGKRFDGFQLLMNAEATELLRAQDRVCGVKARTRDGELCIQAGLVIGADGRRSTVREQAGLSPITLGAPMDVFWFSLPRKDTDPDQSMGRFDIGRIFILINRGEHWQCGFVIAKGSADQVRNSGIESFQNAVATLAPFARDRVYTLRDWEQIKLLTVGVDRLTQWHAPGLLCIGDAAHTMSPVGGVGINLAIQDAVAAANILWRPLRDGKLAQADLQAVQARRMLPVRITQRLQILMQNRVIRAVLDSTQKLRPPLALRMILGLPVISRLPARLIGLGIRREHIQSPEIDHR
ncbi:MAG: FAD-dependent oxidoreductase [Reyranellaceae bacterium]